MPQKRKIRFEITPEEMEEFTLKKPKRTKEEQEVEWKVKEQLLEKAHPPVEKYYPIYSDSPNAWQADLMFVRYTNSKKESYSVALLNVININTKFAFSQPTTFKKKEDQGYGSSNPKNKKGAVMIKVFNKSAKLTLQAFEKILSQMKALNAREDFQKKGVHLQIDTLYVDEGGEFQKEFAQYCSNQGVHLVVFPAQAGTKRKMGIVERFNRTLRRYLEFKWAKDKERVWTKLSIQQALPHILEKYNFEKKHTSIRKFQRWTQGLKGKKEQMKRGLLATPFFMSTPAREHQFMKYKKQQRKKTETFYKPQIEKLLKPHIPVRYFLPKDKEEAFHKSGKSTLSTPQVVVDRHQYQQGGKVRVGDSFQLQGTPFRVMPYDVLIR